MFEKKYELLDRAIGCQWKASAGIVGLDYLAAFEIAKVLQIPVNPELVKHLTWFEEKTLAEMADNARM